MGRYITTPFARVLLNRQMLMSRLQAKSSNSPLNLNLLASLSPNLNMSPLLSS